MSEENKNMKDEGKFIFSKLNKYFIFPFLLPISGAISSYLIRLIIIDDNSLQNNLLICNFISLSLLGGGLSFFIYLFRTYTNENKENERERENERESQR